MRAVWYDKQGAARDVLTVGEMPMPAAGPGEVRVRLVACGVNPSDCNRRGADGPPMEHARVVPNSDGLARAWWTRWGRAPPADLLGRRVWLHNGQRAGRALGTAAQAIALRHELVAPLPDALEFEAGACLGIPAMTAHWSLFSHGPVRGQTVLVTGGAGAVGHYAVQLAGSRRPGHRHGERSGEGRAREGGGRGPDRQLPRRGRGPAASSTSPRAAASSASWRSTSAATWRPPWPSWP